MATEQPAVRGTTPAFGPAWTRWAWRRLTSMRTALLLLALLALAAIPGSLLPQRNVASDPSAVPQFYVEHPTLAPWLNGLGLFHVYSAPWFAAIYLLLLVSMTGCVLPRCVRLWREVRAQPPRPPTRLDRQDEYRCLTVHAAPAAIVPRAAELLRRRGFRVTESQGEVRAEKGFSRELGNLVFHLSLLVLLVGVASGKIFGFEGRAALVEGDTFVNVRSAYDAFTPSAMTDVSGLTPFSVTLDSLESEFAMVGARVGEPRRFDARVRYTLEDGTRSQAIIRPNEPLDVEGTKLYLTGHGYAPSVTVRDGRGDVAFSGPVIFLPLDGALTSDGVIKAQNAKPAQLGFEGLFLPTATDARAAVSQFPGLLSPRLDLVAYTGDLGMGGGAAQSVFSLDKTQLNELARRSLAIGETWKLPGAMGSVTFDGVARFANFQIAHDPGKEISLAAAVLLLTGLTVSLLVRRRRVWVKVSTNGPAGALVELASRSLTGRSLPDGELIELERELASSLEERVGSIP